MKLLFIGDIVGKPARNYLKNELRRIRQDLSLDCVIANGENAAGGSSITLQTAKDIFESGVDIVTTGDHVFKKTNAQEVLETMDVLRPLNYGPLVYGRGYIIKEIKQIPVAVVNLIGRVFMQPADCPFKAIRDILEELRQSAKVIIVDVHAEATSEKLALGYFLAGKVSAVIGTHTHIPTADERIIDGFTAYITDAGMTGSFDSVLGRERNNVIERFITNLPVRFDLAHGDVRIQGVVVDIDEVTGQATRIRRIEYKEDNK